MMKWMNLLRWEALGERAGAWLCLSSARDGLAVEDAQTLQLIRLRSTNTAAKWNGIAPPAR